MCGIVGYVSKDKRSLDVLIEGLKTLEYRGYDSAGVAYLNNNELEIKKEKGKIDDLLKILDTTIKSNIGIGHTRWATHGKPNSINSHPHKNGKIILVHNGIIENYMELKEMLLNKGYNFVSETDTEVAAALLDYLYNSSNDMIDAIRNFKTLVRGSYALGIINTNDYNTLYAIRKDSPLIIAKGDNINFIASDVPAILKYTNKYMLLEPNEIAILGDDIKIIDDNKNTINKEIITFEGKMESAMKNGYDHFMIKEIHEEPEVIKNATAAYNNVDELISKMPDFKKYDNIDIVACGSAYHTGLVAKNLIEEYAGIRVNTEVASEYRYKTQFHNENTLVIVVSQSGETADTLACLRKVKENNIDTLAIVNVVGSSIAREAKDVLYIKAGPEIAVATTKAYLAQLALLGLIALNMAYTNGKMSKEEANKVLDDLKELPKKIENLIGNPLYKKIADTLYTHNDIFFIGRNVDYALSMEGSLKLKEISYIHSEAYAAGELKHDTISLIDDDTPVIGIVTEEKIEEKTISNIKEVKARGANVILITTDALDKEGDYYDNKIVIPTTNKFLQPTLTIVPLQIISYEVAKLRGCDIDKPKNLAKSVTVE